MAPIEEWMRAQETLAEQLTTILLSSDSVWVILANLIVIAVTAGITRGVPVQRSLATSDREMDLQPSYDHMGRRHTI